MSPPLRCARFMDWHGFGPSSAPPSSTTLFSTARSGLSTGCLATTRSVTMSSRCCSARQLQPLLLHALILVAACSATTRSQPPGAGIPTWAPSGWRRCCLRFTLSIVESASRLDYRARKNTLSLAFYLAAALAYLRFDEGRARRSYLLALAFFILSLLCKTVTASLPAALLVVFWWRRGRIDWRRDVVPLTAVVRARRRSGAVQQLG